MAPHGRVDAKLSPQPFRFAEVSAGSTGLITERSELLLVLISQKNESGRPFGNGIRVVNVWHGARDKSHRDMARARVGQPSLIEYVNAIQGSEYIKPA